MINADIPAWAGHRAAYLANLHIKGKERYFWNDDCGIPSLRAFALYIAEHGTEGATKPVTRYNPHTGQAYTVLPPSNVPYAADPDCCDHCDGYGRIWNNADPTSGQWVPCDCGAA